MNLIIAWYWAVRITRDNCAWNLRHSYNFARYSKLFWIFFLEHCLEVGMREIKAYLEVGMLLYLCVGCSFGHTSTILKSLWCFILCHWQNLGVTAKRIRYRGKTLSLASCMQNMPDLAMLLLFKKNSAALASHLCILLPSFWGHYQRLVSVREKRFSFVCFKSGSLTDWIRTLWLLARCQPFLGSMRREALDFILTTHMQAHPFQFHSVALGLLLRFPNTQKCHTYLWGARRRERNLAQAHTCQSEISQITNLPRFHSPKEDETERIAIVLYLC